MTRFGLTLLTVGLGLVIGQARADDKEDKEKGQSEWTSVSREKNGKSHKAPWFKLKIESDKFQVISSDQVLCEGTFAVDSSKKPKTFDATFKSDNKLLDGVVLKGLYELDG